MVYKSKFGSIIIPQCNILSYLFPASESPSTRPLLIDAKSPYKRLSSADLLLWVQRFALGLDLLGVPINTAVMVFTPNHLYVPVAYLAAAGSKRYYTGANPAYTVDELSFQISMVRPAVVLIHPSLSETGYAALKKANLPSTKVFLFDDEDCDEQQGYHDWKTFLAPAKDAGSWRWDDLGRESTRQIATINFSSGTTGLPKGVCISHHNLVSNALQTMHVKLYETEGSADLKNERWLAFLPLYHAFSQLFTINIASRLGVTVYIMQGFNFVEFLYYLQRYRITTIQAVPSVMNMLAKRPETAQYDLSSLKNIMVGAAPMPLQISNELTQRFNISIARGWGMTETTCVGILEPDNVRSTDGNSGYLLPNTEAKTVSDDGQEVVGTPGELWIRGPQTMLGYWNNEKTARESCSLDGWVKTGDIVVVKDHKWWVVDRKKELIKVNGLQVAPAELEALLLQHEGITDAAVVGLEVDGSEYPRAYVVLRYDIGPDELTETDVQRYVAGSTAKYKHLRGGVRFKQSIPRLQSGKIMRSKIREWAKRDAKSFKPSRSNL
jgi:4-coumarate--CoA ligase